MLSAILVCFILLFYLSTNIQFNEEILNTKSRTSPLAGTWTAKKYFCLDNCSLSDEDAKALLGTTIAFSENAIHTNNTTYKFPSYKVKLVNSDVYLWDNYRIKPSDIGINTNTIKIYSVTSKNFFLDDYIKINDNYIARSFNGVLLFYKKSNSNTDFNDDILSKPSKIILSKAQKDIISETGLVLGLRYKRNNGYSYKTLFISDAYNKFTKPIQVNDLIVPRKSGFGKMCIDNSSNQTNILEYPLMKYSDTPSNLRKIQNVTLSTIDMADFVNNDYVFLDNGCNSFYVFPLDDINSDTIAFSKIFGLYANNYLKKSAKLFLMQKEKKSISEPNVNSLDTNWGIIRRSGKWILRGRMPAGDFDISFDIPKALTSYDNLYIPFSTIKQKYPDVTDVYDSINKDFLVVLTKSSLMVLPTNNNIIGLPVFTINLSQNETVVMAQWCTGTYVNEWQKLFSNIAK